MCSRAVAHSLTCTHNYTNQIGWLTKFDVDRTAFGPNWLRLSLQAQLQIPLHLADGLELRNQSHQGITSRSEETTQHSLSYMLQ